jgi:hypothetical protein
MADPLGVQRPAHARARIEQAGGPPRCRLADSPDCNPGELAFARRQEGVRAAAARTRAAWDAALRRQRAAVTAPPARAW